MKPTQCIWTDLDSNKKYMIDNKGNDPVYVNAVGQIPPRFNQDITGVSNYKQREVLSLDERCKQDQALAMKVETPKSLSNIQNK